MSATEPPVSFRRVPSSLNRAQVESIADALASRVAKKQPFHCLIATDRELRNLNARFLGKDYATDVLSFPESGDIAISYQRAASQAKALGHSVEQEIGILMLHGSLHLLGMDHESDRGEMARAEMRWRKKLGLPNSLIERARA